MRASCGFVALLTTGCFYTSAPEGWLPTPEVAQREAYGGWIKVDYITGGRAVTAEGELIAVSPDSLHVLTADSLVTVVTSAVVSATLTTYDARLNTVTTWASLGAVSTLSHGFGLLLSMPIWILVGTSAVSSVSKTPRVQSVDAGLLRPYARFPQGLPPGLDRRALRQKEVSRT